VQPAPTQRNRSTSPPHDSLTLSQQQPHWLSPVGRRCWCRCRCAPGGCAATGAAGGGCGATAGLLPWLQVIKRGSKIAASAAPDAQRFQLRARCMLPAKMCTLTPPAGCYVCAGAGAGPALRIGARKKVDPECRRKSQPAAGASHPASELSRAGQRTARTRPDGAQRRRRPPPGCGCRDQRARTQRRTKGPGPREEPKGQDSRTKGQAGPREEPKGQDPRECSYRGEARQRGNRFRTGGVLLASPLGRRAAGGGGGGRQLPGGCRPVVLRLRRCGGLHNVGRVEDLPRL